MPISIINFNLGGYHHELFDKGKRLGLEDEYEDDYEEGFSNEDESEEELMHIRDEILKFDGKEWVEVGKMKFKRHQASAAELILEKDELDGICA